MPGWVLILTQDLVELPAVEEGVRLGGYSPRHAPDLERGRVLLRRGEPPVAVIVDIPSTGDRGIGAARELAAGAPILGLSPEDAEALAEHASAAGIRSVLPPRPEAIGHWLERLES